MSQPKKKISRARRGKRRFGPDKGAGAVGSIVVCPNCGSQTRSHSVCNACGNYKGKSVLPIQQKDSPSS